MKSTNPFLPSLVPSANPARVRTTVIVALTGQAILMAVLLIQGCKPSVEAPQTPTADVTSSSTTTNANTVAVDAVSNSPAAATNFASVSAPAGADNSASNSIVPLILPPLATNDAPPAPASPALKSGSYVVVSGDSFSKIAKAAHTTIRALKAANPEVNPRRLKVGQILNLPDASTSDLASSTANSPAGAANDAPAPAAPSGLSVTAPASPSADPAPTIYVVKSGDTLFRIARLEHTTVKRLRAINNLTSDKIVLGQKLKVADSAQS